MRITNKMIIQEMERNGKTSETFSHMDAEFAWQAIRERNGAAVKMKGEGLAEVPAASFPESRADKIYDEWAAQ